MITFHDFKRMAIQSCNYNFLPVFVQCGKEYKAFTPRKYDVDDEGKRIVFESQLSIEENFSFAYLDVVFELMPREVNKYTVYFENEGVIYSLTGLTIMRNGKLILLTN